MLTSMRFLVACVAALAGAFAAAPVQAKKVGAYHIFPTADYLARTGQALPDAEAAGQMLYYGGSVFSNVKVVSVIWGPDVNLTTVATIPDFTKALVDSTYVDQMAEYDTHRRAVDGRRGTRQSIGRGTFLGQFQITPKHGSKLLTNDDVWMEIKYQTKNGLLPPHDVDTLYMIYFPADVTITLDGLQSCIDYGAYHFSSNDLEMKKSNIYFSVEPDCGSGISFITFAASHEFAEAVTDNIPTPGSNPAFPQAWNNASGYEVADLCGGSGQLTKGAKSWTVTQYYVNSLGRCSTGNYTSP